MNGQHNISIRHLRAFLQVADSGSFTRAAENQHQTQSTLTATIKQLEQAVGLSLFDRTTRRVVLTREGQSFLPQARQLISDFDTAIGDLQAVSARQQGLVTIASSPSTLSCLLPPVVQAYRQAYPGVEIHLKDDNAAQLEQLVIGNQADFAIAANHSQHADLNYQTLLEDDYGVIMPADHPLASAESISWQNLQHETLIHLSEDSGIRQQLNQRLPDLNSHDTPAGIETSTPSGLAALVGQGLGITVLPALAASTPAFDALTFIHLRQPVVCRKICIISRKARSLSPAAASFLQLLQDHISTATLPAHVRLTKPD